MNRGGSWYWWDFIYGRQACTLNFLEVGAVTAGLAAG
jgi:hypothetical protein